MKFLIGKDETDAQVASEGTYRSKTGATLRQLTISFTIEGADALETRKALAPEEEQRAQS